MLGLDALELDGDLLTGDDVGACRRQLCWRVPRSGQLLRTKINVTETAATNLAADSVLVADTEILPRLA